MAPDSKDFKFLSKVGITLKALYLKYYLKMEAKYYK